MGFICHAKSHAALRYNRASPLNPCKYPQGSSSSGGGSSTKAVAEPLNNQLNNKGNGMPHVSKEAMQLIQFCNHCSFELSVHSPERSKLKGQLSTPRDGKLLQFGSSSDGFECSIQDGELEDVYRAIGLISSLPDMCEEEVDNKYYPFITEPREDCNLTLAKLNGGGYHCEPGAPRELFVKKCLRGKRMNGILRKNSASLENAIRPVKSDWNSWWEKEYLMCLMNDDLSLHSVDNKDSSFKEGCSYSLKKARWSSSRKKLPFCNTAVKSTKSNASPTQDKDSSSSLDLHRPQEEEDGDRSIKSQNDKRSGCEGDPLREKITDLREKLTRKKMASFYANFCLVISVPLCKLITVRQLKKCCKEEDMSKGGKHRIFTGAVSNIEN